LCVVSIDEMTLSLEGTTPGIGTLDLDTGYHLFVSGSVKCVATIKQWVTAVEHCECECSKCGSALEGMKRAGGR